MLKVIDVGLMSNHLNAHQGVIKRLELYTSHAKNQQLVHTLNQQIGAMKNHVNVMNQLLNTNNTNAVTLPPIPRGIPTGISTGSSIDIGLEDRDISFDAHFTANAMANDNFVSSSNMKDQQAKRLHNEMAMQESTIANQYEMLAQQLGWANPPNATKVEQTQAMNHLANIPPNSGIADQQTDQRFMQ